MNTHTDSMQMLDADDRGTTSRTRCGSLLMLCAMAGLALAAPAALAQDALGSGNVLDGNLNVNGRQNTRAPDIQDTIRAANAIVTGNSARGSGFRGQLDYTASGDFRADLGADVLSSFRRDSYFSGLAGLGYRGTEAIQFQSALITSQRPSAGLLRNLVLDRPFSNTQADNLMTLPSTHSDTSIGLLPDERSRLPEFDASQSIGQIRDTLDEEGAALWSMRSASAYQSMRSLSPALIATLQEDQGRQVGITSSTLRGLRAEVLSEELPGLAAGSRDRNADDQFQLTRQDSRVDQQMNTARQTRVSDVSGSYLSLLDRLEAAATKQAEDEAKTGAGARPPETDGMGNPRPGETPDGAQGGVPDAQGSGTGTPMSGAEQDAQGSPTAWRSSLLDLRSNLDAAYRGLRDETGFLKSAEDRAEIDPEVTDLLDKARGVSNSFRVPLDPNSLYAGHVAAGEALMSEQRYFDAEHRFTRALAVRTGNGVAEIGRVHAQMGAGMVWSASRNLRMALVSHPEMIAERYGPSLLPAPVHAERLRKNLLDELAGWMVPVDDDADRIEQGSADADDSAESMIESAEPDRAPNTADLRAKALLLAYMGYQYQRAEDLQAGLTALRTLAIDATKATEADGSVDGGAEGDLMLSTLVGRVWKINGD